MICISDISHLPATVISEASSEYWTGLTLSGHLARPQRISRQGLKDDAIRTCAYTVIVPDSWLFLYLFFPIVGIFSIAWAEASDQEGARVLLQGTSPDVLDGFHDTPTLTDSTLARVFSLQLVCVLISLCNAATLCTLERC